MSRCLLFIFAVSVLSQAGWGGEPEQSEQEQPSAETCFWRGVKAQQQGKHKTAIAEFSKAIKLNPSYADAYQARVTSWVKQQQFDKAVADCSTALRLNPTRPRLYYLRAKSYHRLGEYKKAIKDLDDLILLGTGEQFHPHYHRGLAYSKLNEKEQAIQDIEVEIDKFPERLPVLAELFFRCGRYPPAAKCYTLAIHNRLDKIAKKRKFKITNGPVGNYSYGGPDYRVSALSDEKITFSRSEFEEQVLTMIEKFSTAPYVDPSLADLYYSRGSCLLTAGASQHAVSDFQEGMRFCKPDSPQFKRGLTLLAAVQDKSGIVQFQEGETDKAIASLSKLLHQSPATFEALKTRRRVSQGRAIRTGNSGL